MKSSKAKIEWFKRFSKLVLPFHPRIAEKVAQKLIKRCDTAKNSIASRSKKKGVLCTITVEDLRRLVFGSYGKKCKYCDRILTIKNITFDHIIPMSKEGTSTPENMHVICRTSNNVKGSLDEENFLRLLDWLKTVPESLSKDILIRLSRGIH